MTRLLLSLLILCLFAACGSSCSGTARDLGRAVAGDAIDCTTDDVRAHAAEYGSAIEAALRAAIDPTGHVDRTQLRDLARGLGLRTGACVLASTVTSWLAPPAAGGPAEIAPQASPLAPDPADLRAAVAELYPGQRFSTPSGVL